MAGDRFYQLRRGVRRRVQLRRGVRCIQLRPGVRCVELRCGVLAPRERFHDRNRRFGRGGGGGRGGGRIGSVQTFWKRMNAMAGVEEANVREEKWYYDTVKILESLLIVPLSSFYPPSIPLLLSLQLPSIPIQSPFHLNI